MPAARYQRECQTECQITCENVCQLEGQNVCQIKYQCFLCARENVTMSVRYTVWIFARNIQIQCRTKCQTKCPNRCQIEGPMICYNLFCHTEESSTIALLPGTDCDDAARACPSQWDTWTVGSQRSKLVIWYHNFSGTREHQNGKNTWF